ncbi:MAG TPA: MFS transporter, partial [Kofleriaceae bacterium]
MANAGRRLDGRLAVLGALALAAASTGVVIPAMRALVEQTGRGAIATGVFNASHVVGGVVGAALGSRALAVSGSPRRLALAGLSASILVTLAIAAITPLELRVGLRFLDGACHLLAVTSLIAVGTAGAAELRARRAVWMGVAIVLGVAGGLGLGGAIAAPTTSLVVAAGLSAAALLVTLAGVTAPAAPPAAAPRRATSRPPLGPGLLAFGERFIFGMLSTASLYLAPGPGRIGLVLGTFMVSSLVAMPVARRYAQQWGARKLAVRSTLVFALGLALAGAFDIYATIGAALPWAIGCGAAAGALYASALVLAARSPALEDRVRDMSAVQASGGAGHALGALCGGWAVTVLPGTLAIAVPGVGVIVAATIGVWLTVPEAARDCPV